jgi:hypothetical protein
MPTSQKPSNSGRDDLEPVEHLEHAGDGDQQRRRRDHARHRRVGAREHARECEQHARGQRHVARAHKQRARRDAARVRHVLLADRVPDQDRTRAPDAERHHEHE